MTIHGQTDGETRSIIAELELAATPEQVWSALTDPRELVNWFPFMAGIELNVGGRYDMSWQGMFDWVWQHRITELDPGKRIKLLLNLPPEKLAERTRPLHALEYTIESRGGKTILRMVNSGFSTDTKWDDEYESHFGGWTFELYALAHYLKFHRGKPRKLAWAMVKNVDPKTAFDKLLRALSLDQTAVGSLYSARLADGRFLSGTVEQFSEKNHFAGLIENYNHGLFRISSEDNFLFIWFALYDIPHERLRELQYALAALLSSAFTGEKHEIVSPLNRTLVPTDSALVSLNFDWAK